MDRRVRVRIATSPNPHQTLLVVWVQDTLGKVVLYREYDDWSDFMDRFFDLDSAKSVHVSVVKMDMDRLGF